MPNSLSREELQRLRQLSPSDPYKRHIYNYSMFMGDQMKARGGYETMRYQGTPNPILRLMPEESVSGEYPYVFAKGSEWALPPGWDEGYLSYYAMSGVDAKGGYVSKNKAQRQVNVPPGTVMVPARMARSSFQNSRRAWPHIGVGTRGPARPNGATTSYVSLG